MDDPFSLIHPPIMSASGCWAQTETQVIELMATKIGAVCLKSLTFKPRIGNPEPNYLKLGDFIFNAKGLPNQGYEYYKALYLKHHLKHEKPLILSIAFENTKFLEYIFDDLNACHISPIFIEVNLSCPNVSKQNIPGYHLATIKKILALIKTKNYRHLVIGLKCPPYLT